MFFKKKPKNEPKLINVVTKRMDTGHIFWNISDDLGHSANEIMASTPMVIMSYAYARRSAAAALYVQGIFNEDAFNHAESILKRSSRRLGIRLNSKNKLLQSHRNFC